MLAAPDHSSQPCTQPAADPCPGMHLAVALPGAPVHSRRPVQTPDSASHRGRPSHPLPLATGLGCMDTNSGLCSRARLSSGTPHTTPESTLLPTQPFPSLWGSFQGGGGEGPTAPLASERPSAFLPSLKEHQKLNRAAHETLKGTG